MATGAQADDPADLAEARRALAGGRYEMAGQYLEKVNRPSLERTYLRTRWLLWTGQYREAASEGEKARAFGDEGVRRVAPWHAEALVRAGKRSEAMALLRRLEADDLAHRAHLMLGELLVATGRRGEAEPVLMKLVSAYNQDVITSRDAEGLTLVARATHLLRAHRNANDAYNQAEKAGGKRRVETLLGRAELFLEKYNPGGAGRVTREAVALAPGDPRVRVMTARVKLESALDFAAAEAEIEKALAIDPHLAEAHVVRAGLALRVGDIEGADAALDRVLTNDPENLDVLSMKAATRFLADDREGFERFERRVLDLNANFSKLYRIVGTFASWEHRYAEIVAMMRKAVKLDPDDAQAFAQLGFNLIRNGEESAGLEELRRAWRRDKFNVRVFNTLNLYEEKIPAEYRTVEGTTFRIRYHKREKPVLERYVPQMLEAAWSDMVKRYGFTPKTPVGIELYADSESFSIRTSGLPNVGIQGVCFGKTLAALSPGAGSFNWGMILWHELAHVFHIQQSDSHVPRWFTEGLAEYETIIARPEWKREEHLALYRGLKANKIPKVASFNRAFTHVDDPRDVVMAYFAASQIAVFLAEEFGFEKVAAHLPQWAQGKRTADIVPEVLGLSADELDRRFNAWLARRLKRYEEQFVPDARPVTSVEEAQKAVNEKPNDPDRLARLALSLFSAGKKKEAEATLTLAKKKAPGAPGPRYLELRIQMTEKQHDAAARTVQRLLRDGHDGYAVRMKAADLAEIAEDEDGMRKHLGRAHRLDPSQAEPLQALYDLAQEGDDESGQLWALRELAKLSQHDRIVYERLLKLLVKKGQWDEATKVGESAMYLDVMNPEIHRLYARSLARTGRHISAIYELNSALKARPGPEAAAAIYRSMAEGYQSLGREDYARRAEALAVRMDKRRPAAP
ncbi:MAG: tetratricopeptide repeat protein [Myxococcota bacterium]